MRSKEVTKMLIDRNKPKLAAFALAFNSEEME